jgi:hypothetical protein
MLIRWSALLMAGAIAFASTSSLAECTPPLFLPAWLMLFKDGQTIAFFPPQFNDVGPFTKIPNVMKLDCHFDQAPPSNITWQLPVAQSPICEGDKVRIRGHECTIQSITPSTLGALPDVDVLIRILPDGSASGLANWFEFSSYHH